MKKFLLWAPRVLAIALIVFLSLFSLDVFQGGFSGAAILGFLIHSIPAILLLILLIIAWKRPRLGGILFLAAGIVEIFFFRVNEWMTFFIIILPVLIIGIFFLWGGHLKKQQLSNI